MPENTPDVRNYSSQLKQETESENNLVRFLLCIDFQHLRALRHCTLASPATAPPGAKRPQKVKKPIHRVPEDLDKLEFVVIYTHLELRYEMSHTITSHHVQQTEIELAEKLDKIPDILKDDGYPDVQAFMKIYRKAEAIVTQYNQDLAEWEQTVKNGQKPAEKQHRPPERQSVRNRLRQLQEEGRQNSQPKQRKKSHDRDR